MNTKDSKRHSLKAFSLIEVIIMLVVVSVIISSGMLVMSVRKTSDVNVDKNVQDCLVKENGNLASVPCNAAILGCRYNKEASCNALIAFTKKSEPDKAYLGLSALKESCFGGGMKACDFIVQNCATDGKCDVALTEGDLNFFMLQLTTRVSKGREYIAKQVESLYKNGVKNIVKEIDTDCPNSCNDAGDNYYRTACDVLRRAKGKGYCADTNATTPVPAVPIPPSAPSEVNLDLQGHAGQ